MLQSSIIGRSEAAVALTRARWPCMPGGTIAFEHKDAGTEHDGHVRDMTAPLLAIVAARDALLDSQGTADRLQRLVPRARIRLLPDAGHVVRNQAVAIVDFLKSD